MNSFDEFVLNIDFNTYKYKRPFPIETALNLQFYN
jgi:hypothetical protein